MGNENAHVSFITGRSLLGFYTGLLLADRGTGAQRSGIICRVVRDCQTDGLATLNTAKAILSTVVLTVTA